MIGFSEDKLIYTGKNERYSTKLPQPVSFPDAPPWRTYAKSPKGRDYDAGQAIYRPFKAYGDMVNMVNMAIYLRRPLLVTGVAGVGKTSLAYDIAYELQLGPVLEWPITSHTTLLDGLYHYDAMGRLHAAALGKKPRTASNQKEVQRKDPDSSIGDFITLGALGTALVPRHRPRLLLIDEFDKSDYDLPNDLLYILETGRFEIPELKRIKDRHPKIKVGLHKSNANYLVKGGEVACAAFPLIVITSNDERELPAPFLRRCVRLKIEQPNVDELSDLVLKHLTELKQEKEQVEHWIGIFNRIRGQKLVANDQLLNAVYLISKKMGLDDDFVEEYVLKPLD